MAMTAHQKALNLLAMANTAQLQGEVKRAASLCRASLAIKPTAEACTCMGWIRGMEGDLEGAIAWCRRAVKTDPEFGTAYADMGGYLVRMRRFREARRCFQHAQRARRYGLFHCAYFNLAALFESLGREGKAIEAYRLSMSLCPGNLPAEQAYWRLVSRLN